MRLMWVTLWNSTTCTALGVTPVTWYTHARTMLFPEILLLICPLPERCRNPTVAKCGGEAQHLEKLEVWSPPGLPNV
jgi:hypothetical protein